MANVMFTKFTVTQAMLDNPDNEPCNHIMGGGAVAYAAYGERDSFGPVCCMIGCKACYDQMITEQENSKVCCDDCKQEKLAKETSQWRWFDFYEAQGDTPLVICNTCLYAPKHKQRVAEDRANYDYEFGNDSHLDNCADQY